ncbi:MAG TPA: cytochrome-c oxidase, cbb3-type subunit III [Nevskiaceae bacterium]
MSTGWSIWVIFLVVFNMGLTFFLLLWAPRARIPTTADGTTGHVWSSGAIREGLHRLPRWWIVLSLGLYAAAGIYLYLYPGFGARGGALGWTQHGQLARQTAANDARLDPLLAGFAQRDVAELSRDPQALQLGKVLFQDNCAACHGRAGQGNQLLGAPDLASGARLYGGSGKDLVTTITDGRNGVMPPWSALGAQTVDNLTEYVLEISGQPHDAGRAAAAAPIFKSTCAACHGAEGKGNQAIGAPNLTDTVWLYGGTRADIHATISGGRQGHMPSWKERLDARDIHVLAAYVYSLPHEPARKP